MIAQKNIQPLPTQKKGRLLLLHRSFIYFNPGLFLNSVKFLETRTMTLYLFSHFTYASTFVCMSNSSWLYFFVWLKVTIPLKMWFILNLDSGPVCWPRVSKTNVKTLTVFCSHDGCHWLDHSRLRRSAEYYVRRVMGIVLHLLADPITPHRLSPQRTGQRLPSQ